MAHELGFSLSWKKAKTGPARSLLARTHDDLGFSGSPGRRRPMSRYPAHQFSPRYDGGLGEAGHGEDHPLISPKDPLMTNTPNCTQLNSRGRWCRAAVTVGTEACRHHQDGPVRDWTPDDYKAADAAETERQAP